MKIARTLTIIFLLSASSSSRAEDVLGLSLSKLGVLSNVNKPGIINDQLGGFMTGGSIHTRNPMSTVNPLTVQAPSLRMGCGGIDLFTGGFGYINSEQLQGLIKNIGSSALTYGSMLAIKTISPQISDLLSELESMARFLNSQNINSCQMGASIAAGLWPKTAASQDLACQARSMGDSKAANFFTARYNCSKGDSVESNKNEYKGLLGTEFNLVWHAMKKKNPNLDKASLERLMSISGTLLSRPGEDKTVTFEHKPSLLREEKMLTQMIYGKGGSSINSYQCSDGGVADKCMQMKLVSKQMKDKDSILSKVQDLITSIAGKFLMETNGASTALTDDEKHLVESSSVPILKIISLETAMKGQNVSLSLDEYSELITIDFLIGFLDQVLDEVYQALATLEYNQIDGEPIRKFKEEIRYIKNYLASQRQGMFEHMNTVLSIKQRISSMEQMVRASFEAYRSPNND
jgi:conjugative transfer pilus assembly protein TraH